MKFLQITNRESLVSLIERLNLSLDPVILDVETSSKEPRAARLVDVQISGEDAETVYLFSGEWASELLKLDPRKTLVAHSYRYDAHVLYRHGVDLLNRTWRDTLLTGHLLDENRESYSLDSYVKEIWKDDYKEKFWAKHESYESASEDERLRYACADIYYTGALYRRQLVLADGGGIPQSLIQHVHALQASLLRTEIEGIRVDLPYLHRLAIELEGKIRSLKPEMKSLVYGETLAYELEEYERQKGFRKTEKGKLGVKFPEFSFDSGPQLQDLLYERLGLCRQYNEKTRRPSTDETALVALQDAHPVIPKLLEYRGFNKIYTAFIQGTEDRLDDGRIYPEFRVNGTKTGRISHSNPNLGQLPKSGGIRGIYRPDDGCVFLSADYSQLEVCLEANLTGDTHLARIFQEGLSKHDVTASGLGLERDLAKTLNFACQYRASHFKVASLLGISEKEGRKVWDNYWNIYSGCRKLQAETDAKVDRGEAIVNLFGRKRRFEKKEKRAVWDKAYRQAYNFLIQGTGADLTNQAFYLMDQWLREHKFGRGLLTIHDELLIECLTEQAEVVENKLKRLMVEVGEMIGLKIPLKVECSGPMDRWRD